LAEEVMLVACVWKIPG